MRPIRLPEPPGVDGMETPEIFSGGGAAATVVRRAVLIGNGSPGAENQCLGLARALGLADNLTLYVSSFSFCFHLVPFYAYLCSYCNEMTRMETPVSIARVVATDRRKI